MSRLVRVRCRISRSAFSGERVFRIVQSDGEEYVGAAPEHYFRKVNGETLKADEPAPDTRIEGTIQAIEVRNGGDTVRLSLPDSEAVVVSRSQLRALSAEPASVSV